MKRARTTSWTRNTMRAWVLATRPTRRISSQFFPSFPLRSILLSPRILFPVCLWSRDVSYTFPFVSRVVSFRLVFSLRLCHADVVDRVRGCRQTLASFCYSLPLSSFLLSFYLLSAFCSIGSPTLLLSFQISCPFNARFRCIFAVLVSRIGSEDVVELLRKGFDLAKRARGDALRALVTSRAEIPRGP